MSEGGFGLAATMTHSRSRAHSSGSLWSLLSVQTFFVRGCGEAELLLGR